MKRYLPAIIVIISVITVVSGLAQLFMPGFVLGFIGAETAAPAAHFFRIIGMFMALFGGLLLHTVYNAAPDSTAVVWCALQKLGAAAMVGIAVQNGLFSAMALGVAAFDLLSAFLLFVYFNALRKHEGN
jgi:uncharacterized protein YjeT (DUF2065 family)